MKFWDTTACGWLPTIAKTVYTGEWEQAPLVRLRTAKRPF